MTEKEILASQLSKAEKARKLFDLGKTRKEVANLILGGNIGWAYNIEKAHKEKKQKESGTQSGEQQVTPKTTPEPPKKNEETAKLSIQAEKKVPVAKTGKAGVKPPIKPAAKKAVSTKPAAKGTAAAKGKVGVKAKPKKKGLRR